MTRFDEFLHHTGERITLPKSTRNLILAEVSSDLEDLFQYFLKKGLSEEEASVRAEEMVDLSDEVLTELVQVHSQNRGWADRFVRRAQSIWERIAMVLIVLYFAGGLAFDPACQPFANLSGYALPIALILLAIIVSFVAQMVRPTDDQNPRQHGAGLATPLFLGAASLTLGFMSAGVELYRTLMRMAADAEHAGSLFMDAALSSASTITAALVVTLCAGLSWFVLAGRVARMEDKMGLSSAEVK